MEKDPQTYAIIGAAQRVHKELKSGFYEKVYQEALAIELADSGIPFEKERQIHIYFKGHVLSQDYFADFVCYGDIIVELKALPHLGKVEEAQILHYLNATKMKRGVLLNFGAQSLEFQRYVMKWNGEIEQEN